MSSFGGAFLLLLRKRVYFLEQGYLYADGFCAWMVLYVNVYVFCAGNGTVWTTCLCWGATVVGPLPHLLALSGLMKAG